MRKEFPTQKVIALLWKIERAIAQGGTASGACRSAGVSEARYLAWRQIYGRVLLEQAIYLKGLEQEIACLKKEVNDLSRDKAILNQCALGFF